MLTSTEIATEPEPLRETSLEPEQTRAWFKKRWFQVTPKVDKAAPAEGFRVSSVTLF
jgi:hypothetical protein